MHRFFHSIASISFMAWLLVFLTGASSFADIRGSNSQSLVDYYGHYDNNGTPRPFEPLSAEEQKRNQALTQPNSHPIEDPFAHMGAAAADTSENSEASLGLSGEEIFTSQQLSDGIPHCTLGKLKSVPLSQVKDIHDDLNCKVANGDYCQIKLILDEVSRENNLPKSLIYAVAYAESQWRHWEDVYGMSCKTNPTDDWGLMQVNAQFRSKTNWSKIENDPLYNARFATSVVLKWSYQYVRETYRSRSGEDFYRSVYAVYNGGPSEINRPFRYSHPNDRRFVAAYESRPWLSSIRQCQ